MIDLSAALYTIDHNIWITSSPLSLVFTALFLGLNLSCHFFLFVSVSHMKINFLFYILPPAVSPKFLFSVPYSLLCILFFWVFYLPLSFIELAKIHNSSTKSTQSACNLHFIFDEYLTVSDQIASLSSSCYYHIRQLWCIHPSFLKLSLLLPLSSFTQNLITTIHFTTISLNLSWPVSNRSRTLLHVPLSKRQNSVTSLWFFALFTGLA